MEGTKWIYFVALMVLVSGEEEILESNPDTQDYRYRYFVRDENTGDIKSQEETKQGEVVNGHYSVGEPTGDLRVVTYTADSNGFRADVKYEEGGSPASGDKARQTSATSGVDFHWIPQNADLQEGKVIMGEGEDDNSNDLSEATTPKIDETTENGSTTEMITTTEASTTAENFMETSDEPKENEPSTEKTSETTPTALDGSLENTVVSTEGNVETITDSLSEAKEMIELDRITTESEQSAEGSAPVGDEILPPYPPSNMYLPVFSYQNLPFLNLPNLHNVQYAKENPPMIIYASQNFYNPWQYFGDNARRVAREVKEKKQFKFKLPNTFKYHSAFKKQ